MLATMRNWFKDMPLRRIFYIEQACYALISLILVITFWKLIGAESKQRRRVTKENIKWKLHRAGLLAALVQLARSIDPFGMHGIYSFDALIFLSPNITAFLLVCMITITEATTLVSRAYRDLVQASAAFRRRLELFHYFIIFMTFAICQTSYILVVINARWWYSGIYLFWVGIVLTIFPLSYVSQTFWLLYRVRQARRSMGVNGDSMNLGSMAAKAFATLVFFLLLIPYQFFEAHSRLTDKDALVPDYNLDEWKLADRVFMLAQLAAVILVLVYSW
jgi:hypothetical protein